MTTPTLPVTPFQAARLDQDALWAREMPGVVPPHRLSCMATRLTGQLRADALIEAIQHVVQHQEGLRARFFRASDGWRQTIEPDVSVPVRYTDLSTMTQREGALHRLLSYEGHTALDTSVPPRLRVVLIRLAELEHVLVITGDRVTFDGWWSRSIMNRELASCYNSLVAGEEPELAGPSMPYSDYLRWQTERMSPAFLDELLAFWRAELDGIGPLPPFRVGSERGRIPPFSYRGARLERSLEPDLGVAVGAEIRRLKVTPFIFFLTSLNATVQRYSGDPVTGAVTAVANRPLAALNSTIGPMSSLLTIRSDLTGAETFAEKTGRVRAGVMRALRHREMPHDLLVERMCPGLDYAHQTEPALVLTAFSRNGTDLGLDSIKSAPEPVPLYDTGNHSLWVLAGQDRFDIVLEYPEPGCSEESMQRFLTDLTDETRTAVAEKAASMS